MRKYAYGRKCSKIGFIESHQLYLYRQWSFSIFVLLSTTVLTTINSALLAALFVQYYRNRKINWWISNISWFQCNVAWTFRYSICDILGWIYKLFRLFKPTYALLNIVHVWWCIALGIRKKILTCIALYCCNHRGTTVQSTRDPPYCSYEASLKWGS